MTAADLTELLRASRPVAPETLRERVRAVAAATPAPSPFSRIRLPRLRLVVPAVAATALAAAGLIAIVRPEHQQTRLEASRQLTHGAAATTAASPTTTVPVFGAATDQAQQAQTLAPATKQASGAAPAPTTGRAVDYQAQIGIEVKDAAALSSATGRAQAIARDLGGYVVSVEYASADTGNASLTLRVPTTRVQDAIARLTALGTITSQQVQIQDLQEQLDALAHRTAVLRGRIAHITVLLADPDLTAVRRAQLEADRAQLQTDLRSTRAQSTATTHRAALATIQLTLTTREHSATPPPSSRIDRTLHQAGRIITWEGVALLYGLVVAGPFALVGLLAWFAARQRRRSIEARLLARSS